MIKSSFPLLIFIYFIFFFNPYQIPVPGISLKLSLQILPLAHVLLVSNPAPHSLQGWQSFTVTAFCSFHTGIFSKQVNASFYCLKKCLLPNIFCNQCAELELISHCHLHWRWWEGWPGHAGSFHPFATCVSHTTFCNRINARGWHRSIGLRWDVMSMLLGEQVGFCRALLQGSGQGCLRAPAWAALPSSHTGRLCPVLWAKAGRCSPQWGGDLQQAQF